MGRNESSGLVGHHEDSVEPKINQNMTADPLFLGFLVSQTQSLCV